jgi:hypothetical protein
MAWLTAIPPQPSPTSGPIGVRARVGFSPKSPQHDAGMRIDPPPSFPCAAGTMPLATAGAAPPDDPPGLYARFHGFFVGPNSCGFVVGTMPNSGVFVLPKMTSPLRR